MRAWHPRNIGSARWLRKLSNPINKLLISYDLRAPGKDYTALWAAIRACAVAVRVLESVWIVQTAKTPAQMRDVLASVMDANDRLLVVEVTGQAAAWQKLLNDWPRN